MKKKATDGKENRRKEEDQPLEEMQPSPPPLESGKLTIFSRMIPVENDFLLLEIFRLHDTISMKLEKGGKNPKEFRISLYTQNRPMERIHLQKSHCRELDSLPPGEYRLFLNNTMVFRFKIKK